MTPTSSLTTHSSTYSANSAVPSPSAGTELTPEELKDKQEAMEVKVQQIWHVLSGYEESSAALIGDMLRAVNGRQLMEIILLAERFILHVETLFAVIDDLEAQFALAGVKGESPVFTEVRSDPSRNVTCTGGQTTMPKTGQPILDDVANLANPKRTAKHSRHVHPDHPARSLPQDPHPYRAHWIDQAGERPEQSYSYD